MLESALPVGPSQIAGGSLTAPLIYVGTARAAVLSHLDVKGKIAVKRGAVGVFNLVRLPGNELSRDFSDCGNPCLNIGGRDGWFLASLSIAPRRRVRRTRCAYASISPPRRSVD